MNFLSFFHQQVGFHFQKWDTFSRGYIYICVKGALKEKLSISGCYAREVCFLYFYPFSLHPTPLIPSSFLFSFFPILITDGAGQLTQFTKTIGKWAINYKLNYRTLKAAPTQQTCQYLYSYSCVILLNSSPFSFLFDKGNNLSAFAFRVLIGKLLWIFLCSCHTIL